MNRLSKHDYMMGVAKLAAQRSSCIKRQVGCVLVDRQWRILSVGYNGAPCGMTSCDETGNCFRYSSKSGERLGDCIAVHAEQNAILQCKDVDSIGAVFVTTSPCESCMKLLLNTPFTHLFYCEDYPLSNVVAQMLRDKNIKIERI